MKRTKRWWSHLTKSERVELVWLNNQLKFRYDPNRVVRRYELVRTATTLETDFLLAEGFGG